MRMVWRFLSVLRVCRVWRVLIFLKHLEGVEGIERLELDCRKIPLGTKLCRTHGLF